MLAFARKQPLAPVPIDLTATIPDLVPLLRRTLGEHIDVRYVETVRLWPAMTDATQLESAVLNLALNARDDMPGGGRLTIEMANKIIDQEYARRHAEVTPGDYTMLAVSDTGHGMPPEIMARIFEPFFTTKSEGTGTGLGLAMVFGFVKQSAGHIKVYSEPGEGTTVRLYLPRAIGAAAPVRERSTAPIELSRGSATVLVVEDEPAVREIAMAMLSDLGYRVLEAADGERSDEPLCAVVTFRCPDECSGALDAQEAHLGLEGVGHVLQAMIVANGKAARDVLADGPEVPSNGLAKPLERLVAGAAPGHSPHQMDFTRRLLRPTFS